MSRRAAFIVGRKPVRNSVRVLVQDFRGSKGKHFLGIRVYGESATTVANKICRALKVRRGEAVHD